MIDPCEVRLYALVREHRVRVCEPVLRGLSPKTWEAYVADSFHFAAVVMGAELAIVVTGCVCWLVLDAAVCGRSLTGPASSASLL